MSASDPQKAATARGPGLTAPWPAAVLAVLAVGVLLALGTPWWPALLLLGLTLGWGVARIVDRRHLQVALQHSRLEAESTLQTVSDGVLTLDASLRLRYANARAERLLDIRAADRIGQRLFECLGLDGLDQERLEQALQRSIDTAEVVTLKRPLNPRIDGRQRRLEVVVSPVSHNSAAPASGWPGRTPVSGLVLTLLDVTEHQVRNDRRQHTATDDPLTGLPGRARLTDRLQHAVLAAQRRGAPMALLFLDIDRFRRINDSLGQRQGDAVLRHIADRLRACCEPHDTVARWGGDEFVVLLEQVHSREQVAARALQMLEAVQREVRLEDLEVACTGTIGIAMAPQDGASSDTLLAMANTAMYRGKAMGGKRFEFHSPEMPAWTREWLALEARLRHGLGSASFELHYQPQVNLLTGRPVGLEALLRWRQPDGELWAPARFLDVVEETGLILAVGAWVVREAVSQIAAWRDAGVPLLPVSVNVSARQCTDRHLAAVIAEALAAQAVPAALLKIEITESTAMADLAQLQLLLEDLRALGVGVSMDDFGTGFSSLSHLRHFPVDQIKIDPSFIHDIHRDPSGAAIVRATIALAHGLGVPVVAEGVESEEQMRFLAQHHCDIAQGYLYAQPLPAGEVAGFLARGTTAVPAVTPAAARLPTPAAEI